MDKPTKTYNDYLNRWEWRLGNKLYREDGPTIEWDNGNKEWWLNGHFHREDGPAIEYFDGDKEWYLNGKQYSEKDFKIEMRQKKLERILNE